MPPKQAIRLKGQDCLDFWTGLCKEEKEVGVTALEQALVRQFGAEEWAVKLIVNFAINDKAGKATISAEEFDNFVRRFLPFKECVPLAINALIDKSTKFFYPWFHGFLKTDFPPNAEKQFYVRLSTNTQAAQGEDLIPAHCLVLHYKKVQADKANVAVRLITRHKIEGKYQYQPSSDDRGYDSFAELIKLRMTDQGFTALPSGLAPSGGAKPVAAPPPKAATGPDPHGMYHSQLTVSEAQKEQNATVLKCDQCSAPATLWCAECGIQYCEADKQKDHAKGNRVSHKVVPIAEKPRE